MRPDAFELVLRVGYGVRVSWNVNLFLGDVCLPLLKPVHRNCIRVEVSLSDCLRLQSDVISEWIGDVRVVQFVFLGVVD